MQEQIINEHIDYSILQQDSPINILAVEDDLLSMTFLEELIKEMGHKMYTADNGQKALAVLEENKRTIDVVLMDREMPVMDGLSAVKRIKATPDLRDIPVIMVTGADSIDDMREGLDAGVFYYLTKPVEEEMLRSVLVAALREAKQKKTLSKELAKHRTSFHLIESCKFNFSTIDEAESLAAFIANCFPDPERVLPGLGELLINAVEHGILGVGYDKKTELVTNNIWRAEIERMQRLPQNAGKTASATLAHKNDGVYIVIEDPGPGFKWQNFIKIDPARAGDNHGRGIAQANTTSFDKLTYNDQGNKAIGFVSQQKQLDW
jgi:two-component system cell cycle response regulator